MNKFFKVLSPLIIATSLIGLASCGEEESFSFGANSIKEALTKLQTINDYTLNVDDTYQERSGKIYYTESRFYNELEGSGYIKSINGVFDCYLDNEDNLVGGEILLNDEGKAITNIYTNDLVKTFNVFDLSKIESNDPNSLVLIDNQSRNSFLSLLNVPYSALLEISSFEITMKNNDLSTLTFDMQFNNETYINMTLENINSSKVDIVDNYIRSGGTYFTPNEDLIKIRNLFANDNYTREVYSGGTNPEYVGKEIFNKQYYAGLYEPEFMANSNMFVGIDNQEIEVTYVDEDNNILGVESQTLFGIYICIPVYDSVSGTYVDFNPILYRAYNDETANLSEAMMYPSCSILFDQYEVFEYNEETNEYVTDEFDVAYDFYQKMFLNYHESYETALLHLCFKLETIDNKDVVTFTLNMTLNGIPYNQDFIFTDFNTTSFEPLEEFVTTWKYTSVQ